MTGMLEAPDKTPFRQAFKHLMVLDLNWWSGVSSAAQKPFIELLLRLLRTEYRLIRDVVQIPHFLDVLRLQKKKCVFEVDAQGDRIAHGSTKKS